VLAVDEGDDRAIEVTYAARTAARGFESSATGRIGKLADQPYASLWWATTLTREFRERGTTIEAGLRVGLSTDQAPMQTLFLLGGRHTLPGYAFRSFIGNRMALLRVEASQAVLAPWLKVHVFGVAGATGFNPPTLSGGGGAGWPGQDTDGVKSSAGLGLQLGWDLLRFDVGRGLNDGGDWEFVFSVQRRFWEWL
jgi:outer membrane protein assembly factor BamA